MAIIELKMHCRNAEPEPEFEADIPGNGTGIPAHPWLVQIALKRICLIFKLSFNKPGIQENDMLRKVGIDMKTFRARENKMQF